MAGMLICPECASSLVVVTAEQMFDANTGDHYCHSVKTQDPDAKAKCRICQWTGRRDELQDADKELDAARRDKGGGQ